MKSPLKEVVSASAAALLLASSLVAFSSAAQATDEPSGPPAENKVDRTIRIDEPAPVPARGNLVSRDVSSAGTVEMWEEDGDFLPATPAPGESVQVVYTDAVSLITTEPVASEGVAAACTKSLTAYAPRKVGNFATLTGSGTISTGCSSGDTATVGLYNGWVMHNSVSWSVANSGNRTNAMFGTTCASSASTPLYGIARWTSGGSVWGPTATLACRP